MLSVTAVGSKPRISKMTTLQKKEKTCLTFNGGQWNQTFFPSNFGPFLFWAILHEIHTQCKEQQAFSNYVKKLKNDKNGGFVPTAAILGLH